MKDLIKALQILLKYDNPEYPTNCSHDLLFANIDPEQVSEEDLEVLDVLGFMADEDLGGFISFKFGSC